MTITCDFEPLDRLARFSWDWAPVLCRPEHGCADYHQTWSMVRLLELNGSLPAGAPFFERELGAVAQAGKTRVLVCGGADTGVSALVVKAFRAAGKLPRITFVDRCETSCSQNRLMLHELGLDAEIRCLDALEIDGDPVSAVVAHSFLQRFTGEERERLLQAWSRVVEPGGILLLSGSFAPNEALWDRVPDPDVIDDRRQKLVTSALRAGWQSDAADELGRRAVASWSSSSRKPPAVTQQSLSTGLALAGFDVVRIERFDPVDSPGNLTIRTDKRQTRAEVVAVRRGA